MHSLKFRLAAAFATILGTVFLVGMPAQASEAHPSGAKPVTYRLPSSALHGIHVNKLPAAWHGYAPPVHRKGPVCSNPTVLVNENSKLVAEVYDSATGDGAEVDQWTYNATLTQGWCFYLEGYWQGSIPYYEAVNDNSGKCLDDYGYDTYDGAYIDQWDCNGGANQQWAATPGNGSGIRFSPMTTPSIDQGLGFVLEVYGSQVLPGAKVDIWTGNLTPTQSWCVNEC